MAASANQILLPMFQFVVACSARNELNFTCKTRPAIFFVWKNTTIHPDETKPSFGPQICSSPATQPRSKEATSRFACCCRRFVICQKSQLKTLSCLLSETLVLFFVNWSLALFSFFPHHFTRIKGPTLYFSPVDSIIW